MRGSVLVVWVLACVWCASGASDAWIKDLFDPSISLWDPIQSDAELEVVNLGFSKFAGYVAAFGDFDSDKHVDVFVVGQNSANETQQVLTVFLWSSNDGSDSYRLLSDQVTDVGIESVIPSDYNGDGMLDVLVHSRGLENETAIIYFADRHEFISSYELTPTPSIEFQLLLMDYNMDLKPDLFGVNSVSGERGFWVNNGDGTFLFTAFPASPSSLNELSSPHSNAFVDIDGDCLADLVIFSTNSTTTDKFMEIWMLDGTTATLTQTIKLPKGTGQVSFADLNRDGTTDFVFPVCSPEDTCADTNTIMTIYNVQEQLCTSVTGNGDDCLDSDDVCGVQIPFELPSTIDVGSSANIVSVPTSEFGGYTFHWDFPTIRPVAPSTLRLGDFDSDGYPDMLIVLRNSTDSVTQLWSNVQCDEDSCGADATNAKRRTFSHNTDNTGAIENVKNPFAATFFDLGDDGTQDIFVLSYPMVNPATAFTITTIENSVNYGTFFLKTIGLSGLCTEWCDTEPKFPDPKPIGVNQPGAVFKYIWSDNDQDKRVTIGTQLSQSGYLALQTPYIHFGIGDVAHYIQYIYFGVPIQNGKQHYQYFADIMPNSQVSCNPSPSNRPYFWSNEVFMRPSGMTFWTLVGCNIALFFLAIGAFFFGYRERKRDQIEAEEKGHLLTL